MVIAADYPFLDVFWTMLVFVGWVIWLVILVRVLIDPHRIRVEVSDGNTRMPQPCLAPADATSGRGLAIVDGSGLQWGAERHARGKTVLIQAHRQS